MAVDGGPPGRRWRRLFAAETPARLRLLGVGVGALVIARAAVHDDERHLALWQFVPGTDAFGVLMLLLLGLRPRLAEYR